MMRKKQYWKCFAGIFVYILLCGIMTGCGVRDSAIVIPIEETVESNANVISAEDSDTAENSVYTDADSATGKISEQSIAEVAVQPTIMVYVCGAVVNPGVVELPEGSRADDALRAAGGFANDAWREYVNLAARVEDGEKLYFPNVAEAEALENAAEAEQKGLVNINTADATELMTLPGIGESRARDIIAYREEHGGFRSKEELQKVSGIKENMYAKLCDKIVVR